MWRNWLEIWDVGSVISPSLTLASSWGPLLGILRFGMGWRKDFREGSLCGRDGGYQEEG
ncbi:hypothetical protein CK203_044853 [Vitis vinifera]|uniref:Uncharacterized protein n=1 Tax=Vitis vinifera TaxID=29760 RepID=A0A438H0G7_VITVI|nr:hypothetical protein CK203_044853 [Vitis vinifera]